MPLDETGLFVPRSTASILAAIYDELRIQFGDTVDLNVGSPLAKFSEVLFAAGASEAENYMLEVYSQAFANTAFGSSLDNILELFGSRKLSSKATGDVHISFSSLPTSPDPLFDSGDVYFIGTDGDTYNSIADVALPTEAFDGSSYTGTASETIDATNTKVAQKFTLASKTFLQAFKVYVDHVGGAPTFTVTIETDAGGQPSGVLAHANLTLAGFAPSDGVETTGLFTEGGLVSSGDYWIVFERTANAGTFDGALGGVVDQVKYYDGTWNLSANIENANIQVITGGVAAIESQLPGSDFNAIAESLVTVGFNDGAAQTNWATYVDSFTNLEDIDGGADNETDAAYLLRIRNSIANRETASLDGITLAVRNVDGVRGATGVENVTEIGGDDDNVFQSTETGTGSDDINGTNTAIAQKMVLADERFVQRFNFVGNHVAGTPTCTVRLETDASGEPSGVLAFTGSETDGAISIDNGTTTTGTFKQGEYVSAGTYWLVFTQVTNTFDLDGGTGGTADQVLVENGGWAADSAIENANVTLIGGVPPHGFRIYVSGGDNDDIAQAIHDNKPAGIRDDGLTEGTATDALNQSVTRNFDRPDEVPAVFDIIMEVDGSFDGSTDTIRDAVAAYVGGLDTSGSFIEGLEVASTLVRNRIIDNIMEISGVHDVTQLRLGRRSAFATPGALTASEVVNLTAANSEEFIVDDIDNDIDVSIGVL